MLPDMGHHALDHAAHMGVIGNVVDLFALPIRPHQPRPFQQPQMWLTNDTDRPSCSAMSDTARGVRGHDATILSRLGSPSSLSVSAEVAAASSDRRDCLALDI